MSLKLWLPLNENLNNYGLSDIVLKDGGAVLNTNGKTGSCYHLNGKTLSYPNCTILQNASNFSACCWVKFVSFPSNSNAYCISLNGSSSSDSKFILGIFSENKTTAVFRLNLSGSIGTLELNTWYHLAICVSDSTGYMYINGELKNTISITPKEASNLVIGARSTNAAGTTFTGYPNAYYNDIRIYDHCLSKKEVHELAKGLILHYPLDNGFNGNWNLLKGNYNIYTNKNGTVSSSGSADFDTSLMPYANLPGKKIWFSFDYSVEGNRLNNTGDYTKDRYGCHLYLYYTNSSGASQTAYPCADALEKKGTGRVAMSYTIPTGITITGFGVAIQPYNRPAATNNNTWYIKNLKLEIGEAPTDWTPNPTDAGVDILRVNDASGYGHAGTAVQQMETSPDTMRYNSSLRWKDNTDFIAIPAFFSNEQTVDQLTITGWFKTNTLNSTAPNFFNFGSNNFVRGRIAGSSSLWSYWNINGTKQGVTTGTSTTTDNVWHHYAFIFDKGIIKVYFDGLLKTTNDFTSLGTVLKCNQTSEWGLGGYTPTGEKFIGYQSDFRTYVTALSDTDILELYECRPGLDNKGNLFGYEFIENETATPLITKTGLIKVSSVTEEDTTSDKAVKISKTNITSNSLYEF